MTWVRWYRRLEYNYQLRDRRLPQDSGSALVQQYPKSGELFVCYQQQSLYLKNPLRLNDLIPTSGPVLVRKLLVDILIHERCFSNTKLVITHPLSPRMTVFSIARWLILHTGDTRIWVYKRGYSLSWTARYNLTN